MDVYSIASQLCRVAELEARSTDDMAAAMKDIGINLARMWHHSMCSGIVNAMHDEAERLEAKSTRDVEARWFTHGNIRQTHDY